MRRSDNAALVQAGSTVVAALGEQVFAVRTREGRGAVLLPRPALRYRGFGSNAGGVKGYNIVTVPRRH